MIESGGTPTGTIVVPAYNESGVIAASLQRIVLALEHDPVGRSWEIVVVDDGSGDDTAAVAASAISALRRPHIDIVVLRHVVNRGLGGALQTGFEASRGDVVVVLDADLSYHPEHVQQLVRALDAEQAQVALASPYMPGGRTIGVPRAIERRSRMANRFLGMLARSDLHTFTGMVRAYHGPFIRDLVLLSVDDNINVEVLHKTALLHGRIVEVPATLDWRGLAERAGRTKIRSPRVRRKTRATIASGVLFRPHVVLAMFGLMLMAFGVLFGVTAKMINGDQVGLAALGISLLVFGFFAMLASVLSMQIKRGFEEMFAERSAARRQIGARFERVEPAAADPMASPAVSAPLFAIEPSVQRIDHPVTPAVAAVVESASAQLAASRADVMSR